MIKKNQKANGGGKKFPWLVLLLMLISIAACALAGYTFYEIKNMKANAPDEGKKIASVKIPETPLYIPMDTFTVSLKPTSAETDRVLYIGLTLRVKDEDSKLLVEKFLPEIRSRLLMILAHQTAEDLSADDGKNQLIEKIKSVVSKPLAPNQSVMITDVLFNAFILR
ncbi:flagellar basal body-associated protein FliL [Yersinia mollaretii]|uniref:flagellar basal body-associated protein FliL n=1 Tax=Yersinia mollaretii TaxID=33060 RepID=UPI0016437F22|nr:flagellar basal body-associated protein FliL [Yersinia mollaretii]